MYLTYFKTSLFTLDILCQVKGSLEGWPVLLVGNKCDEESGKRQVSTKTGEALEVGSFVTKKLDLIYIDFLDIH